MTLKVIRPRTLANLSKISNWIGPALFHCVRTDIGNGFIRSSLRSSRFITPKSPTCRMYSDYIGLSRYIAIINLSIIAVFVEYLRQFLIDLNQIYRHSSVPKTRLREFFSFLAQAVSEHGAAATFFVTLCTSRCSESLDCLTLA